MDNIDRSILTILKSDARASRAEIARQVGLTPTAVLERIRKLEEHGVILGYEARLSPEALGLTATAYVFVAERKPVEGEGTGEQLARIPGVEEVVKIAGDDCFLVKARAADTQALGSLLDEHICTIPSVAGTRTTIVLRTLLERSGPVVPKD